MGGDKRRVAIACQGGGSHTAFTAGVLTRLLQDERLVREQYELVALSGTSGGAICALLAWYGLLTNDRAKAIALLEAFWEETAARSWGDLLLNQGLVWASRLQGVVVLPVVSPYLYPSSAREQLQHLLEQYVDFARINSLVTAASPLLLVGAVEVRSGAFKVFKSTAAEITVDAILASAALPTLFKAVHIGQAVYWDGLFSQNPPIRDLPDADNNPARAPHEIWVVQINPETAAEEPKTTAAILDRRNQLAGNLSLQQEIFFIEYINKLVQHNLLASRPGKQYQVITVRRIAMDRPLDAASKLDRSPAFIRAMLAYGAEQAEQFLHGLPQC